MEKVEQGQGFGGLLVIFHGKSTIHRCKQFLLNKRRKEIEINKMDKAKKTFSFVCSFVSFLGKGGNY